MFFENLMQKRSTKSKFVNKFLFLISPQKSDLASLSHTPSMITYYSNRNPVNVNASKIGIIYEKLLLRCYSEDVDIDIQDNGDGTVDIYYTVADAGEYTLSIKFGGQPIPDGFYTFTVSNHFLSVHF